MSLSALIARMAAQNAASLQAAPKHPSNQVPVKHPSDSTVDTKDKSSVASVNSQQPVAPGPPSQAPTK